MNESKHTEERLVMEVSDGVYTRTSACICCTTENIEKAYNFINESQVDQKRRIAASVNMFTRSGFTPKLKLLTITKYVAVKDL